MKRKRRRRGKRFVCLDLRSLFQSPSSLVYHTRLVHSTRCSPSLSIPVFDIPCRSRPPFGSTVSAPVSRPLFLIRSYTSSIYLVHSPITILAASIEYFVRSLPSIHLPNSTLLLCDAAMGGGRSYARSTTSGRVRQTHDEAHEGPGPANHTLPLSIRPYTCTFTKVVSTLTSSSACTL